MEKLIAFLKNTKVQIVAAITALSASGPLLIAYLTTSGGLNRGEQIFILFSMLWPYVIFAIVAAAVVANARTIFGWISTLVGRTRDDYVAARSRLTRGRRFGLDALSGITFLVFTSLLSFSAATAAMTSVEIARYALRLAPRDYLNREQVLAWEYFQALQLRDAERVYKSIADAYPDNAVAKQRLRQIERRYALYRATSDNLGQFEIGEGPTSSNSYRKIHSMLLDPFEPDTRIGLANYLDTWKRVRRVAAKLDASCHNASKVDRSILIADLSQIFEPEAMNAIKRANDPQREYCSTVEGRGGGKSLVDAQWNAAELQRVWRMRGNDRSGTLQCPEKVVGVSTPDAAPEGDDDGDVSNGNSDTTAAPERLSGYAASLYSCPDVKLADEPSFWEKLGRFFMPWLHRSA